MKVKPQAGWRTGRQRVLAAVAVVLMSGCAGAALAAAANLTTVKLQKAAVSCQKVIAQVGAKVLAGKLKALDACANAALACVQTKLDKADCLAKAGQTCAKKLNAATGALTKAQAKIVAAKSCASELRLPDLLSGDGLGLGDLAGTCQTDFALDVCTGLEPLAACLVQTHDRAAGARYGDARPRTAELLTLLQSVVLPPVDGLPSHPGCGACSAPSAARKAVEQCGKALTKATQAVVASLEKEFGACAQKVFACVQTKAGAPECLTGAAKGCDKGTSKLTTAFAKFAAAIAKKCDPGVIDFAQLADPAGLNLAAVAGSCLAAPTSAATFAECVQQRTRCRTAELVQQTVARVGAFGESNYLGTLGADLTAACPAAASSLTIGSALGRTFAPRPLVFGSIVKFLKQIRRPSAGLTGALVAGGRPVPTGLGRGVTRVSGPTRVTFGGISKIQFRYRFGNALGRGSAPPRIALPPSLIVAVQRADVTLDDHFEIPLAAAAPGTEVDDELEVTYQDTIPGCAFSLALATRINGVVSEYTPLLQVLDVPQPTPTPTGPTPTPTATATPAPITKIIDAAGDGAGHPLDNALGITVDGVGNVYVVGVLTDNVFKITPGGVITEIIDSSGDGAGNGLDQPADVAVDDLGNVYVTGASSNNVFKITPGGAITEIIDITGDGSNALNGPAGIVVDADENVYVAGLISDNAFKITPEPGSTITMLIDAVGDGPNSLDTANDVAVDGDGNVFVCGTVSNNVFKITPDPGSTITQIIDASGDGAGHALTVPQQLAVDGTGNVYVTGAGTGDYSAFKITPVGTITEIIDASGDGAGNTLDTPVGIAVDDAENVYVTGSASNNVFKITPGDVITEIIDTSGNGLGDGLGAPGSVAVDGTGNVYVSGSSSDNAFKIIP